MNGKKKSLVLAITIVSILCYSSLVANAQTMNLMSWHSSVVNSSIFGWDVTSMDLDDPSQPFILGGQEVSLGDILQVRYVTDPPTDPSQMFDTSDAPNWMKMYVDGIQVDFSQMSDEGTAFKLFILPVSYSFDNGTTFDLTEGDRLGTPYDGDYYYNVNATHFNATTISSSLNLTYITNLVTGVAMYVFADILGLGSFVMEYYVEAANVDSDGGPTTINSEYTEFQDVGAGLDLYLLVGGAGGAIVLVIVVIVVLKRR